MRVNTQNAEFIRSAAKISDCPRDRLPQIAFAGRSNVGKSSVINRILNRKNLARVGSAPGKTTHINYFLIDKKVYLVDLPGYGYAKVSKQERARWGKLIEQWFADTSLMTLGVLIVDLRHKPTADDCVMAQWFKNAGCPFVVVANKHDKIKKSEWAPNLARIRETLELDEDTPVISFSAEKGLGKEELLQVIFDHVTGGEAEAPSQQELIDHYLDQVKKPERSELSIDVDDFTFSIIERSVDAAIRGGEYSGPTEEEFRDAYLDTVEKPRREELSVQLDDFLFGIVEDAADAELNGRDFEMPADEEFDNEIDKTGIISVDNYIPRYLNQAITFSIEDIGGDEAGTMVMCYMMIALIAFIFAVTISNTSTAEAGVIGTLRASGYTKGELIRHYMVLPLVVTLFAAVVGNALGYTVMKEFCVNLYRSSYSLTDYVTVWDASAFILSTVIPIVMMLIINFLVLISRLKLSPLKFLRHDLRRNRSKKAMRLNTKIPFRTRFSLRIFFTNLPGYIVMIIGILFGSVLIAFGDLMPRMLGEYQDIVTRDMISEYQYIVYDCDEAAEVTDPGAEKFAMASYDYTKPGYLTDSITVYGVVDGSKFVDAEIPAGKALVSTGVSVKFGLNSGDSITLDEKYKRDASYKLDIAGVYDYESSLAVFMNIDDFARTFGEEEGYFTGYFSNTELTELPDDDVATVITASDYTKLSTQLMVSMGGMMNLIKWFGALFFIIVVYVLCKQVIERNFQSIAMTKILGFRNGEIGMLYIASTTIAVIVGLLISIPFIDVAMKLIVNGYLYTMMTGYLPLSISPMTYVVMFFTGLGCYIVVAFLQMRKVARVSKSEALKNAE